MTDNITAPTAKEILLESLGTIEASFWTQGTEWAFDVRTADTHVKKVLVNPHEYSDTMLTRSADGSATVNVAQVCSIGALSLTSAILRGEPLRNYNLMADRDAHTRAAGVILADTICRRRPEVRVRPDESSVIINWNDHEATTKEDVIETFKAACENHLLTASDLWAARNNAGMYVPLWFASEAETGAFVALLKEAWSLSGKPGWDAFAETHPLAAAVIMYNNQNMYAWRDYAPSLTVSVPVPVSG